MPGTACALPCATWPWSDCGHDGRHIVLTRDVHATARGLGATARADAEVWPDRCRELRDARPRAAPALVGRGRYADARCLAGRIAALRCHGRGGLARRALRIRGAQGGAWPSMRPPAAFAARARLGAGALAGARRRRCAACKAPSPWPTGRAWPRLATALRRSRAGGRRGNPHRRVPFVASCRRAGAVVGVELAPAKRIGDRAMCSPACRAGARCAICCRTARPGLRRGVGLRPDARMQTGTAQFSLALDELPVFGGVAASTLRALHPGRPAWRAYAAAHAAPAPGRMPHDLPIEFTLPTASDPARADAGRHVLSCADPSRACCAAGRLAGAQAEVAWSARSSRWLRQMPDLMRHVVAGGDAHARRIFAPMAAMKMLAAVSCTSWPIGARASRRRSAV